MLTGHTGFKAGAWLGLLLHRLGAEVLGFAAAADHAQPVRSGRRRRRPAHRHRRRARCRGAGGGGARLRAGCCCTWPRSRWCWTRMPIRWAPTDQRDGHREPARGGAPRRPDAPLALVNVTTDKVYHNQRWLWSYRENEALGGRDPYSNSKACSELVTQSFVASFFPPERRPSTASWWRRRVRATSSAAATGRFTSQCRPSSPRRRPAAGGAAQPGRRAALAACARLPARLPRPGRAAAARAASGGRRLELRTALRRGGHRRAGGRRPPLGAVAGLDPGARASVRPRSPSCAWTAARPRAVAGAAGLATPQALDWVAQWHLRHQAGEGAPDLPGPDRRLLAHLGLDVGVHVGAERRDERCAASRWRSRAPSGSSRSRWRTSVAASRGCGAGDTLRAAGLDEARLAVMRTSASFNRRAGSCAACVFRLPPAQEARWCAAHAGACSTCCSTCGPARRPGCAMSRSSWMPGRASRWWCRRASRTASDPGRRHRGPLHDERGLAAGLRRRRAPDDPAFGVAWPLPVAAISERPRRARLRRRSAPPALVGRREGR